MREVVGVSVRRMEAPRRCTTQPPQSAGLADFKPGYLDLSPEALARLVSNDPIEKHYEVEPEPFARGKYAAVRRCRHRVSGLEFAAKYLKRRRRCTDLRYEILHEVAVLEACSPCAHIVNLYQVFETSSEMILLLELAPGGELQALLDADEVIDEITARRLMRQILTSLQYLHSLNVAHLDIKPQNLVLTGEYPNCDVKLCDFGISRYIGEDGDVRDILGTPDYVAPEVLNYEPISLATDMWSVGVLLYVILTGCSPFGGDTKQETFCNISRGDLDFPDDLFEDITESAKDLMRRLMVKDPRNRLSAAECLDHEWLNQTVMSSTTTTGIPSLPITPGLQVPIDACVEHPTIDDTPLMRSYRAMVGHSRNLNRASALVRTPSLRRPSSQSELKKASASKTMPVHLFAILQTLNLPEAPPPTPQPALQVFIPSTHNPPPPSFPPPLRPVFIETNSPTDLPSVTSSETSSITSDNISEMSIDSTGDCSSLLSSEDTSEWEREWVRECSGSRQRAMSRFQTKTDTSLVRKVFHTSTPSLFVPDNRKFGLQLLKEQNGNEVVIREVKAGRISKYSELRIQSVQSRVQKLQSQF